MYFQFCLTGLVFYSYCRSFWVHEREHFGIIGATLYRLDAVSFSKQQLQNKIITVSQKISKQVIYIVSKPELGCVHAYDGVLSSLMRLVSLLVCRHDCGAVSCGVFSDSDVSQSFDVVVKLPTVNIVKLPVYVELDIPSVISVQSSAVVVYTIHNRSDSLQDFDVIVESSDAFMFAGHRQVSVLYVIVFVLIATFL